MRPIHIILILTCIIGSIFHIYLLGLNDVLKVADSFAYLQMSHFLKAFSQEGLGNGWFGFVYSLPIALLDIFVGNDFLSAKIINIILLNISALILWKISLKFLPNYHALGVIILFFLSPTLLHFNIHILSENIYIPLFLFLFLRTYNFVEDISLIPSPSLLYFQQKKNVIFLGCLVGLLYLTRAEAFIYLGSIGILSIILLFQKQISLKHFITLGSIFLISFFIFISPYLFHLHSLTGEWGLTNKGASNLRQAELRGQEKMDDAGFEQAVAELTPDKHHLIAGFAGGMPYDTPSIEGNLSSFITKDPLNFLLRFGENQKKLYTLNLPEIILGKSPNLFFSQDQRFGSNYFFLIWSIIPLIIIVFGIYKMLMRERLFLQVSIAFYIPAALFFTLFFTLNRYFLIFLPLFLIVFMYGIYRISQYKKILSFLLFLNILSVFSLSLLVYYNIEKEKDEYYTLKQEAGVWLQNNVENTETLKIMERFPIVTYYSGSKTRYITPYTSDIADIYEYASYNQLDILVVDSMDFETYRPELKKYLSETPNGFSKLKEFTNSSNQKVILYSIK